jgi:hypothetical protein
MTWPTLTADATAVIPKMRVMLRLFMLFLSDDNLSRVSDITQVPKLTE